MDNLSGEIQIRVRYNEVDQMGFVHHANYFVYFEMGRTELLRSQGLTYRDLEQEGQLLVVVSLSCRYRTPAQYDELVTLRTTLKRITSTRIDHEYELLKQDGRLSVQGASTLACVDRDGRLQAIPAILLPPESG